MAKTQAGAVRDSLNGYLSATYVKNSIDCGNDLLKEIEKIPKEHRGPHLEQLSRDLTDVVMLGSEH